MSNLFIAVSVDGAVYEVEDSDHGVQKRKLRGNGKLGTPFIVSYGQFHLYARLGYHAVTKWDVTDDERADLFDRVANLSDGERVVFGFESENRIHPED